MLMLCIRIYTYIHIKYEVPTMVLISHECRQQHKSSVSMCAIQVDGTVMQHIRQLPLLMQQL